MKAIASITLSNSDDAIIAIDASDGDIITKASRLHGHNYVLKRANKNIVRSLFCSPSAEPESAPSQDQLSDIRRWCLAHPEIKPLVKLSGHRSRFCGLTNSSKGGLWATLDKDIFMRHCPVEKIRTDKSILSIGKNNQQNGQRFLHAILEVRVEGDGSITLLKVLDKSHLVRRCLLPRVTFIDLHRPSEFEASPMRPMLWPHCAALWPCPLHTG